jgi:hypothetical protein
VVYTNEPHVDSADVWGAVLGQLAFPNDPAITMGAGQQEVTNSPGRSEGLAKEEDTPKWEGMLQGLGVICAYSCLWLSCTIGWL